MPYPDPIFPNSIWDGLTRNPDRTSQEQRVDPDLHDWDRIAAEMIAIQAGLIIPAEVRDQTGLELFTLLELLPLYVEVAGEPIVDGTLVVVRAGPELFLADKDEDGIVSGQAVNTVDTGELCYYLASGRLVETDWTPGTGAIDLVRGAIYYLQNNGQMSTTAPTTGYVTVVGQAQSEKIFNLQAQPPILL